MVSCKTRDEQEGELMARMCSIGTVTHANRAGDGDRGSGPEEVKVFLGSGFADR